MEVRAQNTSSRLGRVCPNLEKQHINKLEFREGKVAGNAFDDTLCANVFYNSYGYLSRILILDYSQQPTKTRVKTAILPIRYQTNRTINFLTQSPSKPSIWGKSQVVFIAFWKAETLPMIRTSCREAVSPKPQQMTAFKGREQELTQVR